MEKLKWGVFVAVTALAAVMMVHPEWTHAQYTPPSGGGSGGSSITQGTYASLPGTCTAGNAYYPTDSLIAFLRCGSGNAWSNFVPSLAGLVTPPVASNFTVVNQGTATFDSTRGGVRMSTLTGDAAFNVHALVKSAPSTPYHAIACLQAAELSGMTNSQAGMVFRESSSGKMITWAVFENANENYVAFYLSSPTAFGGATPVNVSNIPTWASSPSSPASICYRIGDDGTNRTYDISVDGRISWINMGSDSRTSNMTANQVGLMINGPTQEVWFLDYEETP